jgi:membrane-bound lytic murein transglycosylase D
MGRASLVLGAVLLLLHVAGPAHAARARATGKSGTASGRSQIDRSQADFVAGRTLLESQDRYDQARAHYGAKRYDAALPLLDRVLADLNAHGLESPDRRIRDAAGDLLARAGSLRLAVVKAQRAQEATVAAALAGGAADFIGPPPPPLPDSLLAEVAPAPEIPLPDGDELNDADLGAPALDDGDESIAVETHPLVDKWLDYFTGRGRPVFERWLERSGLYMSWMKGILEREGVPTDLVHLVFVESGFNPHARSYASAVGPWQFIRGTAKLFGLTVNSWIDERRDPEASTVAAARYLKHLHNLFNSWPLALASYNAGERTVINAIKRQGTKDFWSLKLPNETTNYVPKFMAVLAISRDPKRYGFDEVAIADPMTYDEITVPGPIDLRSLAQACSTDVEEIRRLNPAVLKNAAPGDGDQVTVRVPDGAGERILASLEDGSLDLPRVETPADPVVLRHKVRRGESLNSLATRYGVPARTIARYNRISRTQRLRVGRTLLIPQDDGAVAAGGKSAAGKSAGASAGGVRTVRVKAGQTLSGIAAAHGTTVARLRSLNGMGRGSVLRAGQKIKVPA